jgi:hypothetical protein
MNWRRYGSDEMDTTQIGGRTIPIHQPGKQLTQMFDNRGSTTGYPAAGLRAPTAMGFGWACRKSPGGTDSSHRTSHSALPKKTQARLTNPGPHTFEKVARVPQLNTLVGLANAALTFITAGFVASHLLLPFPGRIIFQQASQADLTNLLDHLRLNSNAHLMTTIPGQGKQAYHDVIGRKG